MRFTTRENHAFLRRREEGTRLDDASGGVERRMLWRDFINRPPAVAVQGVSLAAVRVAGGATRAEIARITNGVALDDHHEGNAARWHRKEVIRIDEVKVPATW